MTFMRMKANKRGKIKRMIGGKRNWFLLIILCCIMMNQKISNAQTITEVGKTSTFRPEWTVDENFWDFQLNQTMAGGKVWDVAYSPELKQWVCLIEQGNVCVSSDLTHWKRYSMGTMYHFTSIIWANNMYIATGAMFMYSYDGINWKLANVEVYDSTTMRDGFAKEFVSLSEPYWNGSYFFADGGTAFYNMRFYSADGVNWKYAMLEGQDSPYDPFNHTYQYAWNGSRWLWINNTQAHLCYLENGVWKEEYSADMPSGASKGEEIMLGFVKWTGSEYYAFDRDSGATYYSSDGKAWSYLQNGLDKKKMKQIREVTWDGKKFYVYGSDKDSDSAAYSYVPGKQWEKVTAPEDAEWVGTIAQKYYAMETENGIGKLRVYTSSNGNGWKETITDMQVSSNAIGNYSNGYLYFTTSFDKTYRTKDGMSLTEVDGLTYCQGIGYYNNTYLAINNNSIYRSANGTKFTEMNMASFDYNGLNAIINTGGIWCTVGSEGVIYTSKDGKKFAKRKSPTKSDLTKLVEINKKLYAIGYNGTILLSKDHGVTWTSAGLKLNDYEVTDICYGNDMYIAKLHNYDFEGELEAIGLQMMLVSTDGIHWNQKAMPSDCNGMYFYNGYFITTGANDIISIDGSDSSAIYWCSSDSVHWVPHRLPNTQGYIGQVVVGGNKLMMLTDYGDILVTEGKGERIHSNLTITGTITIPEGMVKDAAGMDIAIRMRTFNVGQFSRDCGATWLHVMPGETQASFSIPVKLADLDFDLTKTNTSFYYDVSVQFDPNYEYYQNFTIQIDKTNALSGKDCDINLYLKKIEDEGEDWE